MARFVQLAKHLGLVLLQCTHLDWHRPDLPHHQWCSPPIISGDLSVIQSGPLLCSLSALPLSYQVQSLRYLQF